MGGKSFTKGDWGNMFIPGNKFEDTRESREAESAQNEYDAEQAELMNRQNSTGQTLQGSGGKTIGDISSDEKKKRPNRRGTSSATIPTASTGLASTSSTGLGGL